MYPFKTSFFALFFSTLLIVSGKAQNTTDLIAEFNAIGVKPIEICFSNQLKVNNNGGHLQGIQRFENSRGEYYFLSGSSEKVSYCAVLKTTPENKVIQINNLFTKPYKHAGGFQIFENYLAVGIEDNDSKDKSKVCVYDVSNAEEEFGAPKLIIERNGEPLRSTAGCVGFTKIYGKYLVAVGDWDTKHIDFYSFDPDIKTSKSAEKISSLEIEKISKTGWINSDWNSYQNINLLNINNKLYLIGTGQNSKQENIADLFEVKTDTVGDYTIMKIAAKTFDCSNDCSFKAGAGVEYFNGNLTIFACGYNMGKTTIINVFSNKTNKQK